MSRAPGNRVSLAQRAMDASLRFARLGIQWLPPTLIALAAIGLWELLVRAFHVQRWLLPAPSAIARELVDSRGLLTQQAAVTLEEILGGFGLAAGAGVLLAIGIAYSRTLARSIYPFVIASQMIPIITIAPLLLVWVGPQMTSKIIVAALISFFPVVVNLVDGLRASDPEMVAMMRTLGASSWQIFAKLQMPAALPYLFSGLKVAIVVSVIGAVIGEWVGAQGGLGWLMRVSAPQFHTALVFAAIVLLSAIGIALFALVSGVEKVALRHHVKK